MKKKKLKKSKTSVVFDGICGGIGEYLGVEPLWVRLAFVLLAGQGALLAYIVLMFIMDE